MGLRNISVPAGDIYPNGLVITPPSGDVQGTVRPAGWLFRHSPGFPTIRPGKNDFQDGSRGSGIHFVPQRYAEDVGAYTDAHGYPLMVDKGKAADMVDLADLPGSDRLDDDGTVTPYEGGAGRGVKLADSTSAPTGGKDIRESEKTVADMGDRSIGRPLTRIAAGLHNPIAMFRQDWQTSPLKAVAVASGIVGVIYLLATNVEREFRSRRGRGNGTAAIGAAAATPVAASGAAVKDAADVANRAATAAGEAAKDAASAAGDAASAAGKAAEEVTDAVADAVKE